MATTGRRRAPKLLAALVVAAGAGALATTVGGSESRAAQVTSIPIRPLDWGYLGTADGALWAYGTTEDGPCLLEQIATTPLHVVAVKHVDCAAVDAAPPDPGSLTTSVVDAHGTKPPTWVTQYRMRWLDPTTGNFRLGPVLMTLNEWVGNRELAVDGEGSIFFGNFNRGSGSNSIILQVSETTGKVLHRITVPAALGVYSLVADRDGLFLGVSQTYGWPKPTLPYLYRVPPGRDQLVPIDTPRTALAVISLAPTTGLPLVGMTEGGGRYVVAPLVDGGTRLGAARPEPAWIANDPVVADGSGGYWALGAGPPTRPQPLGATLCNEIGEILHVDSQSATTSVVYRFPPRVIPQNNLDCDAYSLNPGTGVVENGAFYFLDDSGPSGVERIYRAELSG